MNLENLLAQRTALDNQIADIKTADLRKAIDELVIAGSEIRARLTSAKLARKTTTEELQTQIDALYKEIARLKEIQYSDLYFISQLESQVAENAKQVLAKKTELAEIPLSL